MQTSNTKKGAKKPKQEGTTGAQTAPNGSGPSVADREANQELFDLILASIAQDDVIAESGLQLSQRVNECARDYLEAKQIVDRRGEEIDAFTAKIESMQATLDEAFKHLHKAQDIAAEAIDSSVSEQFRLREQDNLTSILVGMTNTIAKEKCHTWPREKVNMYLENLQSVYQKNKHYCQSPTVSSGIVYVAKHFVFHADYDDAFEPMLFHLANQTDYKGFVERSRRQDQQLARQYSFDHGARPSATPKTTNTSTAPLGGEAPHMQPSATGGHQGGPAPRDDAPDGAAGAAQSRPGGGPKQESTALPPRSSSLPSSVRKLPANPPCGAESSGHCGNTSCACKHHGLGADGDLRGLAGGICSKLKPPQPGMTPSMMKEAVLESIAGVEAIFRDGTAGSSPEVKRDVASALKLMERLNKEHVGCEQVARKLSAVAEAHGLCPAQPHEASGGRARAGAATARRAPGQGGQEGKGKGKATRGGNDAVRSGQDTAAGSEDSTLLWQAYVSGTASGRR